MIGHAELPLILGQTELLFGDVTTWQSIKPGIRVRPWAEKV